MITDCETKIMKYISMTLMKGIGPATQISILGICGNIDSCYDAGCDDLLKACETKKTAEKRIGKNRIESFIRQRRDRNLWNHAEEIMRISESAGIKVVVYEDKEYPDRFRGINDMPVVLYIKGKLRINEFENSIGVVGARRCSTAGKDMAIRIAVNASDDNSAVISGMAKGIDSYAHTAAIKSQGYTVAVLGNGADICYPKEHIKLYESIAERGCILSEYVPGTLPRDYHFPKRNRLIAALSDKLYVIDAGRNSGALSTVEHSRKYGRKVIMCGETSPIHEELLPYGGLF